MTDFDGVAVLERTKIVGAVCAFGRLGECVALRPSDGRIGCDGPRHHHPDLSLAVGIAALASVRPLWTSTIVRLAFYIVAHVYATCRRWPKC
jgi:hypothetical protein